MAMASTIVRKLLLLHSPFTPPPPPPPPRSKLGFLLRRCRLTSTAIEATSNFCTTATTSPTSTTHSDKKKKKKKEKKKNNNKVVSESQEKQKNNNKVVSESLVKRRTRSDKEFDEETVLRFGDIATHIPVMLGEVLEVFASLSLRSFVDCTLGAAGHSSAIIQAHPEMQLYVGMDIDPVAHEKARTRIDTILHGNSCNSTYDLKAHTLLNNFRDIKSVLHEVDEKLLSSGVDGILLDLGMSSMQVNNAERGFSVLSNGPLDMRMNPQASLKAEDILNYWPDDDIGRILRDYGEETNWRFLQNKIVQARQSGGLHSTGELVGLIRNSTFRIKGGRQGWIKTATRVFQALRIAVNDELETLKDSLYACFDCLAPGGRLAVISFHSLEDRVVKQTFLNIINSNKGNENGDEGEGEGEEERHPRDLTRIDDDNYIKEAWIRQMIHGWKGTILTKRPITPSEEEEKLNRRSRSAKLRVIQKV